MIVCKYVYLHTNKRGDDLLSIDNSQRFCDLLDQMIKEANLKKVDFYTALGIKKPYFYDILSGKVNPPPSERQLDMIRLLKPSKEKMIAFFNAAALERGEVPVDIAIQLEKREIADNLRKNIDYEKILGNGDAKNG